MLPPNETYVLPAFVEPTLNRHDGIFMTRSTG